MSQDQQRQIQHSLSRLALAKAIKTPDDGESEPWNKSVIFNQPFIKQLQKQKQQLINTNNRRDKTLEIKPQLENNRARCNSNRNPSTTSTIEKRLSRLSIKKLNTAATETMTHRSCLSSDDSEEEEEEDDEDEEEDSDASEVIPVKRQQRPVSCLQKPRPTSIESNTRDDISSPSRGSTSSNTLPLTDEDEVDLAPPTQPNHARSNSWILQDDYRSQQQAQQKYNNHSASNNRRPSIEMIGPMYYQRLQQYQHQLQYQQAMALQQQQQLYLLSQNPSAFFPPGSRVFMEEPITYNNKRHSTGHNNSSSNGSNKHHRHGRMSSTDLRRRAEMMRSSTDSINNRIPPQQQPMYYQQPLTPPVMRSNNGRRPSYNI